MNAAKRSFNPEKHTIYKPLNENKLLDKDPVICKSTWERRFCEWCDGNPNVLKWSSETLQIPYYDPVKRKNRRYFPDFTIYVRTPKNEEKVFVIEIKPYKEIIPPVRTRGKKEKSFLYEYFTYQTNIAKWKSASEFCIKNGVEFKILTEKDLFKEKVK